MKTHTDLEVAKHLDELWQTIERGITVANDALEQAQKIHAFIAQDSKQLDTIKTDASLIANTIQDAVREMQTQKSQLGDNIQIATTIRDDIASQIEEIVNYKKTLDNFKSEFITIRDNLDVAKVKIEQLDAVLPEFTQELPQIIDEVRKLASQVQCDSQNAALCKQESDNQVQKAIEAYSETETLKNEVEAIVKDFGGKETFENLLLDNKSFRNSFRESQAEIERLHKKLETQAKKQSLLFNWLIGVSVGLAINLAIRLIT